MSRSILRLALLTPLLLACDAARSSPSHVPSGPMADVASSMQAMSGCDPMGKVTAKNGPDADFEMREKAAKAGATHVYRAPLSDQSGFGAGLESHERVHGEMFRCGTREGGADGG